MADAEARPAGSVTRVRGGWGDGTVELTLALPRVLWEAVEHLVPEEDRPAFFVEAIERQLLYVESGE